MKKNIMVMLTLLLAIGNSVNAQELTKNMFNVYFGNPKQLTVTDGNGTMVVEFDRQGRVLSKSMNDMKFVYQWDDDNDEVEVTLFNGDTKLNSTYIHLIIFTDTHYKYETDGVVLEVLLNDNGVLVQFKGVNPITTVTQDYFYENDSDVIPQKVIVTNGNMSQTAYFSGKTDKMGNVTDITQSSNGAVSIVKRKIKYY